MIPYYRLKSNNDELLAIKRIHETAEWAVGSCIDEAKSNLAALFRQKQVVLTSSGYSALFISIKALEICGQKIILPCISTCFAIGNAIIATGNTPIFCDVNSEDGNCDINHVTKLVQQQNIKYIISPNYAGNISDCSYFKKTLKLTVIEDACQSFFSSQKNDSIADITVFSFYPTKGLNGIDGGAIITQDENIVSKAERLVYYNDQLTFETTERFNLRFLNINASVLVANLGRQNKTLEKLNHIMESYDSTLKTKKKIYRLKNSKYNIAQRYVVCLKEDSIREKAIKEFKENGISLSSFFEWVCDEANRDEFKNAKSLVKNCFCIPYFEDLRDSELDIIIKTMNNVFA